MNPSRESGNDLTLFKEILTRGEAESVSCTKKTVPLNSVLVPSQGKDYAISQTQWKHLKETVCLYSSAPPRNQLKSFSKVDFILRTPIQNFQMFLLLVLE